MQVRDGKCANFGLCCKADSREIIPIDRGGEFSCPECGKPLSEAGQGTTKTGRGGRAKAAIGALALALIGVGTYENFHAPREEKDKPKIDNGQNLGTVAPPIDTTPVVEQPPIPPNPGRVLSGQTRRPAPGPHQTMHARLLSQIDSRTAHPGDVFTAKLEDGPYKGVIVNGKIRNLNKNKSKAEIELDFTSITRGATTTPVKFDLLGISSSPGVKDVKEENNSIEGKSSKAKALIPAGIGGGVGLIASKLAKLGGKTTTAVTAGGALTGYVVGKKVLGTAEDIELTPGTRFTLRTT
jgi:hypothetical protein